MRTIMLLKCLVQISLPKPVMKSFKNVGIRRTLDHYYPPLTQPSLQELILEKVRDDTMVRRKICQSSALRLKRGPHDLQTAKCEAEEPQPPPDPAVIYNNNNGPCSLKPNELALSLQSNKPGNKEEQPEELTSPDSLSEVSKFESEPAFLAF